MNNKPLNNTTPTFNNKVVVSGNKVVSKEKIRYKYIAFDKNGKQIKGYFDAFRKSDVESFLTVQGYKIAEIKPTKITKIGKFLIMFPNNLPFQKKTRTGCDLFSIPIVKNFALQKTFMTI